MDGLQIVLRLVHIVGGTFWVGAMVFNAAFLFPAIRDAGPDGGKVAAGVMQRKFAVITPIVALFVIGSGLWLLQRASVGFQPEFMSSRKGIAYSTGAAAAIIALLIGLTVTRPAMMGAMKFQQAAAGASGADRDNALAGAQAARTRAGASGNWVATLLVVAASAMAVARYV